jgi:hypothetical protein
VAAPLATAARVAVGDSRVWRAILAALALTILMPLMALLAVLAVVSDQEARVGAAGGQIGAVEGIPPQFIPLYNEASRAFNVNPYLLAAIHSEETGFSTHPRTFQINFAGCCIGPFQFNVTDGPPSSWDLVRNAYRQGRRPSSYPHPDTQHPSPTDTFDAAMAAAQLLRRKAGGRALPRLDATAHAAARAYNGAGPVAEADACCVMAKARAWQAAGQHPGGGAPPAYGGSGRLAWPVSPRTPITSPFGPRWGRLHAGIDLGAPTGTPITASEAGRVSLLWHTPGGGYGNYLCIQHAARLSTCYAHLSRFAGGIRAGATTARGELIGYVGNTGASRGPHLHYEVRLGPAYPSTPVDPVPYLRGH